MSRKTNKDLRIKCVGEMKDAPFSFALKPRLEKCNGIKSTFWKHRIKTVIKLDSYWRPQLNKCRSLTEINSKITIIFHFWWAVTISFVDIANWEKVWLSVMMFTTIFGAAFSNSYLLINLNIPPDFYINFSSSSVRLSPMLGFSKITLNFSMFRIDVPNIELNSYFQAFNESIWFQLLRRQFVWASDHIPVSCNDS